MQRGGFSTTVKYCHSDQDIFRGGFGVLHKNVKVLIAVKNTSIKKLIFRIKEPAYAVGDHQVLIRVCLLRILVKVLHIGVGRSGIEIEIILLDVLAMVTLAVGQTEQPLLQYRVFAVPEGNSKAEQLFVIRDACQAVFSPFICP